MLDKGQDTHDKKRDRQLTWRERERVGEKYIKRKECERERERQLERAEIEGASESRINLPKLVDNEPNDAFAVADAISKLCLLAELSIGVECSDLPPPPLHQLPTGPTRPRANDVPAINVERVNGMCCECEMRSVEDATEQSDLQIVVRACLHLVSIPNRILIALKRSKPFRIPSFVIYTAYFPA